jgi:drug/metabolite transporter (DMT)-like permease
MDEPSPAPTRPVSPRLPALLAGFAAIYLIWGSTFLGIKVAIETLPPLLMAGFRFLLPGLGLFLWLHRRGQPWPTARQWWRSLLTGALLLLGGNGLVTWGQQTVPSGRAALLIATTPMWLVVVGWLFYGGARPGMRIVLGMAAGFIGAVLLIKSPQPGAPDGSLLGFLAVLLSPVAWSFGTHQARRSRPTPDVLLTSALQMITGGALLILVGSVFGEWGLLAGRTVSLRSVLAFGYLAVVGALIGFSTYAWLLRVASPGALATYAYVNPLVAVVLGWLLNGEELGTSVLVSAGLIVGAVIVITLPVTRQAGPVPGAAADSASDPDPPRKSLPEPSRRGYTREGLPVSSR